RHEDLHSVPTRRSSDLKHCCGEAGGEEFFHGSTYTINRRVHYGRDLSKAPKKEFAHRSTSCSMTWLYIADMRSFIASGLSSKPHVACSMAFLMSSISKGLHNCSWSNTSAPTSNSDSIRSPDESARVATNSLATKFIQWRNGVTTMISAKR